MLFTELLKFLWAALRHWMVWVTGTGIVGFGLWVFSCYERNRGVQVKPRTYALVLFSTFWFLATFTAWRDADANLQTVTAQKQTVGGQISSCQTDLKLQSQSAEFWKKIADDRQGQIDRFQGSLNDNQSTINKCVVSLGKMNPTVNEKIAAVAIQVAQQNPAFGGDYFFAIAITSNRTLNASGTLTCDKDFDIKRVALETSRNIRAMMIASPVIDKQKSGDYFLKVNNSAIDWGEGSPIAVVASSQSPTLNCSFSPER
jgi:hypothetical protein